MAHGPSANLLIYIVAVLKNSTEYNISSMTTEREMRYTFELDFYSDFVETAS